MEIKLKEMKLIIIKMILMNGLLCLVTSCATNRPSYTKIRNPDGSIAFSSKKVFLKEYALCACINYGYKRYGVDTNDQSISVYYDLSDDDLVINNKGKVIDSLATAYINSNRYSFGRKYENRRTISLDCIRFFKSKSLNIFIDSILKQEPSIP